MSKHINLKYQKESKKIKVNTALSKEYTDQTGNDKYVFVSIKNLQYKHQCFSEWDKSDMNKFWAFNKKIHEMTWEQVLKTGGKNNKTGIAYTPLPREKYNKIPFIKGLSKDICMFELRIDNKIRVHGFRINSIFYLCVLDKKHEITK